MWERETAKQLIVFSTTPWSQHLKNIYRKISTHWHESNPGVFLLHVCICERDLLHIAQVWFTSFLLQIHFSLNCESMSKSKESWLVQLNGLKMYFHAILKGRIKSWDRFSTAIKLSLLHWLHQACTDFKLEYLPNLLLLLSGKMHDNTCGKCCQRN